MIHFDRFLPIKLWPRSNTINKSFETEIYRPFEPSILEKDFPPKEMPPLQTSGQNRWQGVGVQLEMQLQLGSKHFGNLTFGQQCQQHRTGTHSQDSLAQDIVAPILGTFINFHHKFLQLKFAVCLSVSTGMKIKRHEHEVNKTFGAT